MESALLAILFQVTTREFNLPLNLLSSICYVESTYRINVIHKDDGKGNSVGVCQIKLVSARQMGFKGTEKQLLEPATNIYYAGKFIRHQINRYNSSIRAIVAYNRGNAKGLRRSKYSDKVLVEWRKQNVKIH